MRVHKNNATSKKKTQKFGQFSIADFGANLWELIANLGAKVQNSRKKHPENIWQLSWTVGKLSKGLTETQIGRIWVWIWSESMKINSKCWFVMISENSHRIATQILRKNLARILAREKSEKIQLKKSVSSDGPLVWLGAFCGVDFRRVRKKYPCIRLQV